MWLCVPADRPGRGRAVGTVVSRSRERAGDWGSRGIRFHLAVSPRLIPDHLYDLEAAVGPLVGHRVSGGWVDIIHIAGFSRDCSALRQRTSSLIVPGSALVEHRVEGSAIDVLNEVLTWEPPP